MVASNEGTVVSPEDVWRFFSTLERPSPRALRMGGVADTSVSSPAHNISHRPDEDVKEREDAESSPPGSVRLETDPFPRIQESSLVQLFSFQRR